MGNVLRNHIYLKTSQSIEGELKAKSAVDAITMSSLN